MYRVTLYMEFQFQILTMVSDKTLRSKDFNNLEILYHQYNFFTSQRSAMLNNLSMTVISKCPSSEKWEQLRIWHSSAVLSDIRTWFWEDVATAEVCGYWYWTLASCGQPDGNWWEENTGWQELKRRLSSRLFVCLVCVCHRRVGSTEEMRHPFSYHHLPGFHQRPEKTLSKSFCYGWVGRRKKWCWSLYTPLRYI